MVKLILTMIVLNEENIIKRCILSTAAIIDAICITETGATDRTKEIILLVGKELNLPTVVISDPFKGFGKSRTISRENSIRFCRHLGWETANTYTLHLDADMILQVDPNFKKESLFLPGYDLLQTNCVMSYTNHRLDRCDTIWECLGRTHEFWSSGQVFNGESTLTTLRINDMSDGQSKGNKFERDLKLLLQDEKEGVLLDRTYFYKGQTLRDLNRYEESIIAYTSHIKIHRNPEEAYYAMYQIGYCYQQMMDKDNKFMPEAILAYLKAWHMRPTRGESLYALVKMYRETNQLNLCWLFASVGSQIPFPSKDIIFVHNNVYQYKFLMEMTIIGPYMDKVKKEQARDLCQILLKEDRVPVYVKNGIRDNLRTY